MFMRRGLTCERIEVFCLFAYVLYGYLYNLFLVSFEIWLLSASRNTFQISAYPFFILSSADFWCGSPRVIILL